MPEANLQYFIQASEVIFPYSSTTATLEIVYQPFPLYPSLLHKGEGEYLLKGCHRLLILF